jgi:hypothetical protein
MSATLIIAKADEHLALRLVSALVLCWDVVPLATQGQLLHEAALWQTAVRMRSLRLLNERRLTT